MWRLVILLMPTAALADSVVAARVIKAGAPLVAADMMLVDADIPDALSDPTLAIGLEARIAIYPGRPILRHNIGPQTMVERNQVITLHYRSAGLSIRTEGRALARGGSGDFIEAMNLVSKAKVTGQIQSDGSVAVGTMATQ